MVRPIRRAVILIALIVLHSVGAIIDREVRLGLFVLHFCEIRKRADDFITEILPEIDAAERAFEEVVALFQLPVEDAANRFVLTDDFRRDEDEEVRLRRLIRLRAEKPAEYGNIAEDGNFRDRIIRDITDQAAQNDRVPIGADDGSFSPT